MAVLTGEYFFVGQALRGFALLRLPSSVPDLIGESLITTIRWLLRLGPNRALVGVGLGLIGCWGCTARLHFLGSTRLTFSRKRGRLERSEGVREWARVRRFVAAHWTSLPLHTELSFPQVWFVCLFETKSPILTWKPHRIPGFLNPVDQV